ncbi:SPOR domain-containing protein [Marinobacter sp. CHS3-4]|uniref:SPOR domain-containing protein n=1 Tax=Marinobacter sp. CHS3-4 TaxID=3045174 RepID=UPI0024B58987|nr:SPOR domain-containing protein [Marinobacter sp. CHS3-4]MDI9245495.1 SPOR domain-containing protein [Marinobacter sp. CHS3-4]
MDGLKQRIIGALVLVSLAVIFVPMMFDEPHSERETSTIKIPEEPPFPEVDMPEPDAESPPEYRIEELDQGNTESGAEQSSSNGSSPGAAVSEDVESVQSEPTAGPEPAEESPEAEREPVKAQEYTRSLEGAWVVQLGSFGSAENATRLRERVREKGYNSHLQSVTRGDAELTRVFSGPFAEKAEAEKAKQVLDKAFGLNSLVTSGGK